MKKQVLWELREFPDNGADVYSMPLGFKLRPYARAQKLVLRLRACRRIVFATPLKINR
jgi:hypothetical protein